MALWLCGCAALWLCGFVVLLLCGFVALWFFGFVALWFYASAALWPCCFVALSSVFGFITVIEITFHVQLHISNDATIEVFFW